VDLKAEYSALSSIRSRQKYKKETKTNKRQCPFSAELPVTGKST